MRANNQTIDKPQLSANAASFVLELNYTQDGNLPAVIGVSPLSEDGKPVLGHDGRAFVIDGEKVVEATNAIRLDVVGDCNHEATMSWTKPEAFAWLNNFRIEGAQIVADVNYTELGREKLGKRLFRYISPAFVMRDEINVERIHSVGFVNTPNFTMAAVNAAREIKEADMPEPNISQPYQQLLDQQVQLNAQQLQKNSELQAEIAQLRQENETLKAQMSQQKVESNVAQCNALLDAAIQANKLSPAQKPGFAAIQDPEQLGKALEALPVQGNLSALGQTQVGGQAPPNGGSPGSVQLNAAQLEAARALGMGDQEYYANYVAEPTPANKNSGGQQ